MNKAIARPWLSLQCQMIPGVRHAVFAADPDPDGAFVTLENWPDGATAPAAVMATLRTAIVSESVEVHAAAPDQSDGGSGSWIVACPLRRGGKVCGAVAAEIDGIDESQLPVVTRLMQWGSAWPALFADHDAARRDRPASPALEIVTTALTSSDRAAATAAAANDIATDYDADSVAIGLVANDTMKVVALSGRAVFDRRSDSVRAVELALDEAADQQRTVVWPMPPDAPPSITLAHEKLAGEKRCVCTVPLCTAGTVIGGLHLARSHDRPFDAAVVMDIEALASALGPALDTRRAAERSAVARAKDVVLGVAGRLFGAGHPGLKALAAGAAVLLLFLSLATGMHEVSATAVLEGSIERDMVAAIDGFIADAHVRAGARVHTGDVLATLDDKPLRLELSRLESQRDELTNEYHRALGDLDHGATRVLAAQIRQAEAQLAMVQDQLGRTHIVAPFDGIVVSGDLSQSLGSPVSRGDPLFRLAPLTGYRVVLEVDESDVPAIADGAAGRLVLTALPGEHFDVRVERLNGMASSVDGRNVLEVEAGLAGDGAHLRPGMRGVVRIEAGRARLLWIWTHRLTERLRMWWWAYSPVA